MLHLRVLLLAVLSVACARRHADSESPTSSATVAPAPAQPFAPVAMPTPGPPAAVGTDVSSLQQRLMMVEQRTAALEQQVTALQQSQATTQQQLATTQLELRQTQAQVAGMQSQARGARRRMQDMMQGQQQGE